MGKWKQIENFALKNGPAWAKMFGRNFLNAISCAIILALNVRAKQIGPNILSHFFRQKCLDQNVWANLFAENDLGQMFRARYGNVQGTLLFFSWFSRFLVGKNGNSVNPQIERLKFHFPNCSKIPI